MTDYLDFHTHTLASGHAYSTINDNIAAAKAAGLSILAITEHRPDMDGACRPMYFQNIKVMPRSYGDLTVLFGVELNILNRNGDVEFPEELIVNCNPLEKTVYHPLLKQGIDFRHSETYAWTNEFFDELRKKRKVALRPGVADFMSCRRPAQLICLSPDQSVDNGGYT